MQELHTLGRSDLRMTPICLGTMTFGEQVGEAPTQLALAFCYRNWRVASTIVGVTSIAQLDENVDAWDVTLSPELLAEVDKIRWQHRDPAQ